MNGKRLIEYRKATQIEDDPREKFENDLDEFYKQMPVSEETRCGFSMFQTEKLQFMANKKVLILLFGLSGCLFSSTFAYSNGTITTIEKRYKIPSRVTGIISIGNDITQLLASIVLNYYASRGHRPKWIAFGLLCVTVFCFLNALPHFVYGPGIDALQLTSEYGSNQYEGSNSSKSLNNKNLCGIKEDDECALEEGSIIPPIIFFISQLICGIGGALFHSLGYSYMDDNIKKSKSPTFISLSYFMKMLGPSLGYAIVSICLKFYIAPELTPTINNLDPRWLGAWWLGWIIIGASIILFSFLIALLPKTLPRAAARKELMRQRSNKDEEDDQPSFKDMIATIKRLMRNSVYNYNNLASIFYVFGYTPFWIFLPKYIEAQYRKSASAASFVTGGVGLAFSALGVLLAGMILQKFKPRAKYMAFWNTLVDAVTLFGILAYSFLGCPAVDDQIPILDNGMINTTLSCNSNCACDYAKFSPVCAFDQFQTFISACHAGCTDQERQEDGSIVYTNCSCIADAESDFGGSATSGPCTVDCQYQFYSFVAIICILKLIGSMGRVTNFLVSVRCVEERDKSVSMGISISVISLFALIPAPIFFGYLIDSTCLVWGKTCTGTGNCWYFNPALLRNKIVFTSAPIIFIGILFDIAIWLKINDLNMFDDNPEVLQTSNEYEDPEEVKPSR